MKIPRIPQTPVELVSQIDSIEKRIHALSIEEETLRRRRSRTAQTRTVAYVRYRESGLNEDRAQLESSTTTDTLTSEKIKRIANELQTLNLRKRYLERLACKNGIVLKPVKTSKEQQEQSGGTFGA